MTGEISDVDVERLEELNEKDEDELTDSEVTSRIKLSVKRRFDYPSWLVVFEFQNREGRRADCIALNTMPSRNHKLVGFEFKASRSDWLNEKDDPEKADFFVQLCDEWYVVAGRRGIVEEEELPDGWGLLELKPSGQLWKLVESDLPDVADVELDRHFFTKFMKKAVGSESNFTYSDIEEAKRRGYDDAIENATERELKRNKEKLEKDAENFRKIKDAGLNVYGELREERIERLKKAEQLLKVIDGDSYSTSLEACLDSMKQQTVRNAKEITRRVEELEDALEELRNEVPDDA